MKTSIRRSSQEDYFGVEITRDGKLVVAHRKDGAALVAKHFPAGAAGARALREHIERQNAHPHVCIRACGGAALGLATALIPVPGVEVTVVAAQAAGEAQATPEARAERLAKLAERLF